MSHEQTLDIAPSPQPVSSDSETVTQLTPNLNACSPTSTERLTTEALRAAVLAADGRRTEPFDVSVLWHELCRGTWRFVSTFESSARCYAVLRESPSGKPPDARLATMLALTMSGQSRKALAFDMKLSVSTISGAVQACMRSMGLEARHAPVLLIMAASRARLDKPNAPLCRVSRLELGVDRYIIVSAQQPALNMPLRLSDAESSVVRELVGGLSYAAIAEKRSTSVRTVANQVASAFRKLGVSGRQAMIERLIANTRIREPSSAKARNAQGAAHCA